MALLLKLNLVITFIPIAGGLNYALSELNAFIAASSHALTGFGCGGLDLSLSLSLVTSRQYGL